MDNYFVRHIKFFVIVFLLMAYFLSIYLIYRFSTNEATTTAKNPQQYQQKEKSKLSEKYVILGDTGTGNKEQYEVANAIENICQRLACKAIFVVGDVIYNQGVQSIDDPQFESKFEQPYKNINLPFYIAFGNHDYAGCVDCYIGYAEKSEKWHMSAKYYSIDFSVGKFIVLDTENFDSSQQKWLKQELEQTQGWKIVLGHRPILTYEAEHYDDVWNARTALKDILCNAADLYISGHAHILEDVGILPDCRVRQVVSGGGGQIPRNVLTENQAQFYYEGNGFLSLQAESDRIIVKFINEKGKILNALDLTN